MNQLILKMSKGENVQPAVRLIAELDGAGMLLGFRFDAIGGNDFTAAMAAMALGTHQYMEPPNKSNLMSAVEVELRKIAPGIWVSVDDVLDFLPASLDPSGDSVSRSLRRLVENGATESKQDGRRKIYRLKGRE